MGRNIKNTLVPKMAPEVVYEVLLRSFEDFNYFRKIGTEIYALLATSFQILVQKHPKPFVTKTNFIHILGVWRSLLW